MTKTGNKCPVIIQSKVAERERKNYVESKIPKHNLLHITVGICNKKGSKKINTF